MQYKGYFATVEYDDSVGLLHGSVVSSGGYPVANCEAADVDTLRNEVRRSVDEYLAVCEERGIQPQPPFSGKLNVRLGPELHSRVAAIAAQGGVSINSWIKETLEREAAQSEPEIGREVLEGVRRRSNPWQD